MYACVSRVKFSLVGDSCLYARSTFGKQPHCHLETRQFASSSYIRRYTTPGDGNDTTIGDRVVLHATKR